MENSPMVHIYTAYGALDGEMIRAFLESKSITSVAIQESYGHTLGLTVGSLGEVKIFVRENQAEEAKKLLDEMEAGNLENSGLDNLSIDSDDIQFDDEDVDGDSEYL